MNGFFHNINQRFETILSRHPSYLTLVPVPDTLIPLMYKVVLIKSLNSICCKGYLDNMAILVKNCTPQLIRSSHFNFTSMPNGLLSLLSKCQAILTHPLHFPRKLSAPRVLRCARSYLTTLARRVRRTRCARQRALLSFSLALYKAYQIRKCSSSLQTSKLWALPADKFNILLKRFDKSHKRQPIPNQY